MEAGPSGSNLPDGARVDEMTAASDKPERA
jgi:hypothetical protein